jgi:hypothetical protein
MEFRKLVFVLEEVTGEAGMESQRAVSRAAAIAVFANPYAGCFVEDLSPLFETGAKLGEMMMKRLVETLRGNPVSYGKAAIVGVSGDVEHGAAVLHPKLGKPMRAAVCGGEAIICSNAKVAATGTLIDIPLANKDNIWSFDELDTMTVVVPDAPRPDEIMLAMAVADGGRPRPRVGKGRIAAGTRGA